MEKFTISPIWEEANKLTNSQLLIVKKRSVKGQANNNEERRRRYSKYKWDPFESNFILVFL